MKFQHRFSIDVSVLFSIGIIVIPLTCHIRQKSSIQRECVILKNGSKLHRKMHTEVFKAIKDMF